MAASYVRQLVAGQAAGSGTATQTFSISANAGAGHLITLSFLGRPATGPDPPCTVADSRGNTWNVDVKKGANNNFMLIASTQMDVGVLQNGDTISVTATGDTWNVSFNSFWYVEEFAGLTNPVLDRTANANSSTDVSSQTTGTTAATTSADEVAVAACMVAEPTATITMASYNQFTTGSLGNPSRRVLSGYKILAATGPQSETFNFTAAGFANAMIATYKATGGATTGYVRELAAGNAGGTGLATQSFALTAGATAGDLIILCFAGRLTTGQDAPVSVTDSRGNSWSVDVKKGINNNYGLIASTRMGAGLLQTGDTISVTLSGDVWNGDFFTFWWVEEFSGLTNGALDVSSSNNSTGDVTSISTGTTPPTTDSAETAIALANIAVVGTTISMATFSPFITGQQGNPSRTHMAGYKMLTAAGAQSETFSWTGGAFANAMIATYKSTSGFVNPVIHHRVDFGKPVQSVPPSPPDPPPTGRLWGTNTSNTVIAPGGEPGEYDAIKSLGSTWVRVGSSNITTTLTRKSNELRTAGFNRWLAICSLNKTFMPDAATVISYMTAYPEAWIEPVNEPNLSPVASGQFPTPETLAAQCIAFYRAVKAAHPTRIITTPGLGNGTNPAGLTPVRFVQAMAAAGYRIGDGFDILNMHWYEVAAGDWFHIWTPAPAGNSIGDPVGVSMLTALGNPDFIITEFGAKIGWSWVPDEASQNNWVPQYFTALKAQPKCLGGMWYNVGDDDFPTDPGFGLRKLDGSHRLAWNTYQANISVP